ncbi:heme/hemin ABC transporter substrate-binding protein [Flavobacterium rhizosphaerae]|uniref:ABC transporter substrate-binding protein n=1 Tax=Flavobacterium rhizosphaerae TaxID=3163298 RepID=A0ABW8YSG3_9FLAO
MIRYFKATLLAIIVLNTISCKNETRITEDATINDTIAKVDASRIISLNSAVTEIVSALGYQGNIVGVDVTSTYPEDIKTKANDLGHTSQVNIESMMELKPTLVLATDADISNDLEEKLATAGVTVKKFTQDFSVNGTKKLIEEVAVTINEKDYKPLQDKIDADLQKIKLVEPAPKVLFIYARGANMMMVSGTGTAEEKVIKLAGGQNAVTEFEDFKPLTPEALIKNNPDVLLMYNSGLQSLGGIEGVLKIPGVDKTNAGKNKKIVAMDGGLVHAFGPRVGEAAAQLNALLLTTQPAASAK